MNGMSGEPMQPELVAGNLFEHGRAAQPQQQPQPQSMPAADERIDALVDEGGVTIERIVSTGQASPPGFWYDSPRAEWVVLLSGAATLEFEGSAQPHRMKPGDHVLIGAHRRHRVAWTSEREPSVWLAVYYPVSAAVNAAVNAAEHAAEHAQGNAQGNTQGNAQGNTQDNAQDNDASP